MPQPRQLLGIALQGLLLFFRQRPIHGFYLRLGFRLNAVIGPENCLCLGRSARENVGRSTTLAIIQVVFLATFARTCLPARNAPSVSWDCICLIASQRS